MNSTGSGVNPFPIKATTTTDGVCKEMHGIKLFFCYPCSLNLSTPLLDLIVYAINSAFGFVNVCFKLHLHILSFMLVGVTERAVSVRVKKLVNLQKGGQKGGQLAEGLSVSERWSTCRKGCQCEVWITGHSF